MFQCLRKHLYFSLCKMQLEKFGKLIEEKCKIQNVQDTSRVRDKDMKENQNWR